MTLRTQYGLISEIHYKMATSTTKLENLEMAWPISRNKKVCDNKDLWYRVCENKLFGDDPKCLNGPKAVGFLRCKGPKIDDGVLPSPKGPAFTD